jgi:hypothetical protein
MLRMRGQLTDPQTLKFAPLTVSEEPPTSTMGVPAPNLMRFWLWRKSTVYGSWTSGAASIA